MSSCVFCGPNWPNLDIAAKWVGGAVAIVNPLDPVTPGHVLVVHREHDDDAAQDRGASSRAAVLMRVAADWVAVNNMQANIITSIGPDATQTVLHTHIHVVPRRENDGLKLPWTDQKRCGLGCAEGTKSHNAYMFYSGELGASGSLPTKGEKS